ncbi:MAG: nucleotide exchange factor GrpE [Clostridiales bacterium]|jgi:molecular chaperone GrpE|nr:nucleotide exchange factor GrpE [Eubacteriales bacterium]MDH7565497.1 nucleotide exchange factor GrpE [Clostridiales bacterium]
MKTDKDDIKEEGTVEPSNKIPQTKDMECAGNGELNEENVENETIEAVKCRLDEKTKQCEEYFDRLQRMAAEFDNYKKRTARERETLYTEAVMDCILCFLPVVDNLERAIQASAKEEDTKSLKDGIEMIFRMVQDALKKLGVEEIKSVGEKFDPQLHNAVMHFNDDKYENNIVVEEFQKGYILKDKVIRHSMVKVAN